MTPEHASGGNGTVQLQPRATSATNNAAAHKSGVTAGRNLVAVQRELAELKGQVTELEAQIATLQRQGADRVAGVSGIPSLAQIVRSVATTIVVGAVVRRLPLGLLGAAAAPLLAAQLNHLWPAPTGERYSRRA